jgi:hypothetical protein
VSVRWRNLWRLGAALVVPASVGVVLSPVAAGDASSPQTTQVLATQSTYFWAGQVGAQNVAGTDVAPPAPVTDPTVPSGDVAVAGPEVNGQTNKETYLEFDVSAVPAGSTITSFVVTLPVDQSSQAQSFTPPNTQPPIIACTPNGAWSGGANGAQALAGKPSDTCATDAPTFKSKDGGKTYTADIVSIAQSWVTNVNTGVAVADDPHNSNTAYQVVFGDSTALSKLTAQMTYVPGSNTTLDNPGANTNTPTETVPSETVNVPLVPSGVSPSEQAPSTTTPATVPSAGKPKGSALRAASYAGAGPPGVFWIAAVLIVALLFSASLVLGDEPEDEPQRGRRRLLAGARQLHGGSGLATPSREE